MQQSAHAAALQRIQALLERVQTALHADAVGFTEDSRLDRVGTVFGDGRDWERGTLAKLGRQREAPPNVGRILEPKPAHGVAKSEVLHKGPDRKPPCEALVVHNHRLVLLLDSTTPKSGVAREVVTRSRTLDVLRERLALQLHLPLPLGT